MTTAIDAAKRALKAFVTEINPRVWPGLDDTIAMCIESKEKAALELVTETLHIQPHPQHLKSLWDVVEATASGVDLRVEGLRAATAILLAAKTEFDAIMSGDRDPTEATMMTERDFESQVSRLLRVYQASSTPVEVRRRSLEMAANLSSGPEIMEAGRQAFADADPLWATTGLFVLRTADAGNARAVIEKALEHSDIGVRCEAIYGLAELRDRADLKRLEDYVFDGKGQEQVAAIGALSESDVPGVGKILEEAAQWLDGDTRREAVAAHTVWQQRNGAASGGFYGGIAEERNTLPGVHAEDDDEPTLSSREQKEAELLEKKRSGQDAE